MEAEQFQDGDLVRVTLDGVYCDGKALLQYLWQWPCPHEALFIHLPLRGRYTPNELREWGATITKLPEEQNNETLR